MRPNSREKRVNAGANDRPVVRVNGKFCEALVTMLGQEKLIEFIK
jgi:hypothetical protein